MSEQTLHKIRDKLDIEAKEPEKIIEEVASAFFSSEGADLVMVDHEWGNPVLEKSRDTSVVDHYGEEYHGETSGEEVTRSEGVPLSGTGETRQRIHQREHHQSAEDLVPDFGTEEGVVSAGLSDQACP